MQTRPLPRISLVLVIALLISLLPGPVGATTLSAPALHNPADMQILPTTPLFSWAAVEGAGSYRFQLSTDPAFGTTIVSVNTANLAYIPASRLAARSIDTPYYCRVGTQQANGSFVFSPSRRFGIDWQQQTGPALLAPTDGATLTAPHEPILFQWSALPNADGYRVEVATVPTFTGAQSHTTKNPAISLEPSLFVEATTYYWRVVGTRGTGAAIVLTGWSETRRFSKVWQSQPTLLQPDSTFSPPIYETWFSWEPISGAKQYQIQISPNGDWANNVVYGGTESSPVWLSNPGVAPPVALEDNQYYWRVRARDASNTNGQWSETRIFQKTWQIPPTIVGPAPGSSVSVLALSWLPVAGASQYEVQVSTDPGYSKNVASCSPFWMSVLTTQTSFTPNLKYGSGQCLPRNVTLYWRVRAIDGRSGLGTPLYGPWSENALGRSVIWAFDAPTPFAPSPGEVVTTPDLRWDTVEQADRYRVEVLDEKGSRIVNTITANLSHTPTSLQSKLSGSFTWQVRPIDANNIEGPTLGLRAFTLITPTTAASFDLSAPADQASSYYLPSLKWTALENAERYRIWYRKQGEIVWLPLITEFGATTRYTSYTRPTMLGSGTYEWWVEAINSVGVVIGASEARRFIVLDLPAIVLTAPLSGSLHQETPALHWQPIREASHYRVLVAKDALFNVMYQTGDTELGYRTIMPAFRPTDSYQDTNAGEGYFWIIRPCKAGGFCSPIPASLLETTWHFRKQSLPLALLDPPANNPVYDTTPVFRWYRTDGARYYRIQVATDPNFGSSAIVDEAQTDAITYLPIVRAYPDGTLYWRVQAIDGSGNSLTYSETRSFRKISPAPSLLYPTAAESVGSAPYFTWTPVTGAVKYDLQVSVQNTFGTIYDSANVVGTTSHVPRTKSYAPGHYYWRVRGVNLDNHPLTWSATGSFTVTLAAPTLTDPVAGRSLATEPIFRWTEVPGAGSYVLTIQNDDKTVETATIANNAWAPTAAYALGAYSWTVTARDWNNNLGEASASATFVRSRLTSAGEVHRVNLPLAMSRTSVLHTGGW